MAIDYIVNYNCVPKETLGTDGILDRLKGRARAEAVIQLFRQNGDQRPPSEMGFEFTRSTPDGAEENRVIVVQELLDQADALDPLAHHCAGCPANVSGQPFGCINFIQYPFSAAGEVWLLKQLPIPDQPLAWLLLRQSVEEMGYTGESVLPLREGDVYFEDHKGFSRKLGEIEVSSNQLFEMMFMLGHIQPAHAGVLLMFLNAIPRNGDAPDITEVLNRTTPAETRRERYPFLITPDAKDDTTIRELKLFLRALYQAWLLNVHVLLDV